MSDLRERLRICSLAQLYTTRDSDLFSHTRTHRARDEAALSEDFLSFFSSLALRADLCPFVKRTRNPTRTTTSSTPAAAATPSSAPSAPRSRISAQASAKATPRRSCAASTERATSSGCRASGASVRSRAPPPARRAVNPASGPARREATSAGSSSTARSVIGSTDLLLSAAASVPNPPGRGSGPPAPSVAASGPRKTPRCVWCVFAWAGVFINSLFMISLTFPAAALAPGSLGRGFRPPKDPPGCVVCVCVGRCLQ